MNTAINTPTSSLLSVSNATGARLRDFLDQIGQILENKKRRESFALYACGLFGDGERKSVEPIAARACGSPTTTDGMHSKLLYFLGRAEWEDAPIRRFAAEYGLKQMMKRDPIRTWIVDDTGFIKQGKYSPGVQRQYTGSAGKRCNCQIGVSLVLANAHAQLPVDFRLYLPESWTEDRKRCRRAHIPDEVEYAPKWRLALDMIEEAIAADFPPGVVLADADYGNTAKFRDRMTEIGLEYAVEVKRPTKVRRVCKNGRLGESMSVEQLGRRLKSKFRKVTWREGTKVTLCSYFTRVRVVVDRDDGIEREAEWLLLEWPEGESGPTKFVLSTVSKSISCKQHVRLFKSRWRIERSYEDLKGELGLDHFEGRSFTGWHHHVTVVLCCYAFLVAEQARSFFPSARGAGNTSPLFHAA